MENTDFEIDLLLFAKKQGIDINALNLLISRIASKSEIAPCAHYLGFRDVTSVDKLCTEYAHNGVPCPLNADGEWTIYSNGQEKLIEYAHTESTTIPIMAPIGIGICNVGQKKTAVFYQGETLQSKFKLEKIEINCPANINICQLRAPQFVNCVVKDAKSKITPEQINIIKQYLRLRTIDESIK